MKNINEILDVFLPEVSLEPLEVNKFLYINLDNDEFLISNSELDESEKFCKLYTLKKGFLHYKYLDCDNCDKLYVCDNQFAIDEKLGLENMMLCSKKKLLDEINKNYGGNII